MEYQELPSLLKLEAGLASGAGTPERGALPPHLQPLSGACPHPWWNVVGHQLAREPENRAGAVATTACG